MIVFIRIFYVRAMPGVMMQLSEKLAQEAVEAYLFRKNLFKGVDAYAFLLHGIAVAQRDGVVFEGLVVNGDAEGGADCILAAIAFADGVFLVNLAGEVEAEFMLYFASFFGQSVFLHKRKHSAFHGSQRSREVEHDAVVATFELLVFIAAAKHAEEHTVNAD